MGQTILSKGKNIMEAIELGLNLLGTKKEEVSIEVIQQENKGFFRIGYRYAVVKLTKNVNVNQLSNVAAPNLDLESIEQWIDNMESNDEKLNQEGNNEAQLPEEAIIENLDGMAWVKDGQIFCQPTKGHYPTITVGNGVKLLKNNEPADGTIVATNQDVFELQTVSELTDTKWKVEMDDNRLNVNLFVEPGMKKFYKIKDINPDFHIHIEAEQIIEINNDLDYKAILSSLEQFRVIHGFNHNEIMKAANTESSGWFTIASGRKPIEGENGKIEILVNTDKKIGPQERTNGTIDYREVQVIPTVQKGQVIAFVHPPIPGRPGTTVTNEPIPPKQVYPLMIQPGKGIALIENDTKIVATETGRPLIEQRGLMVKASIIEKLVHSSDVDITSGNIRFKGDIDILGNVEEGMIVESGGQISIFKNVYSASVSSVNSVAIQGNVIKGSISAGKQNIFTSELVYLLTTIQEKLSKKILCIEQLMVSPAFKMTDYSKKGLFPLIKLLLDKKFQSLLIPVKHFLEISSRGSHLLDLEWLTLAEQLRMCFLSTIPNEYHSLNRLRDFQKKLTDTIEKHENEQDKQCFVQLQYALNSSIYSCGDVSIVGQGCYNSKIHAGGTLKINGIFRGGEIYARLGAVIKETGSEGGVISKIIVPSDGTIQIEHAKEGTVLQIGKTKYSFHKEKRWITARLDEGGKIIF